MYVIKEKNGGYVTEYEIEEGYPISVDVGSSIVFAVEFVDEKKAKRISDKLASMFSRQLEVLPKTNLQNNPDPQLNDPIKPTHYRKGNIDLYGSWYQTRPFNEFRAIMESIAERYMKRDKENRLEDLDKCIYTLTRLKEYEQKERENETI